jgi:gliding motility-associated-like protein
VFFYGQVSDTLKLVVKSPKGCSDSDEIGIIVHQGNFASISPEETEICPNTSVPISITGGEHYTWIPPLFIDDTTSATVLATPPSDIDYTVYVIDGNGCRDTVSASILVFADASLDLGNDITIFPGDTVRMNPSGNCMYFQWFPPMGLSQTNISDPFASPAVNTKYYLTGTTEHGCVTTDSINIFVETETALAVPNAFTPGSSGSNSILRVIRRGKAELKSFRIYDRWGMMVFETRDINQGWDGKYKGQPQPMGTYVYIVEAIGASAEAGGRRFYRQGNVTLIR